MKMRRHLTVAVAFAGGAMMGACYAAAAERYPYSSSAFATAEAAGAHILVDISASWCPTCKAQRPILDSLADKPENAELVIFDVDFDTEKDVVRDFKASMQSTLIVFQGDSETGRSVGDTDPDSIAALLEGKQGG